MAANFETLDPDSLVKITPIVKDGNNQVSHGVSFYMTLGDLGAYLASGGVIPAATTTTNGTVKKAATVAAAAVPFADLTAAANKVNEILTSLKAAGVMA